VILPRDSLRPWSLQQSIAPPYQDPRLPRFIPLNRRLIESPHPHSKSCLPHAASSLAREALKQIQINQLCKLSVISRVGCYPCFGSLRSHSQQQRISSIGENTDETQRLPENRRRRRQCRHSHWFLSKHHRTRGEPNVIFILVDELCWPSVFPLGIPLGSLPSLCAFNCVVDGLRRY
jgi:hypothetical protein